MKANIQKQPTDSARKLPASARKFVVHEGRKYPMVKERGVWRVRSRSASHPADFATGSADFNAARKIAAEMLSDALPKPPKPHGGTLESLASTYLLIPKKCAANVAEDNVSRLRGVCRVVFGRELDAISIGELSAKTWREFFRIKQGGTLDLATRRSGNAALNAAVRAAASLFIDRLRPAYAEHGITFAQDIATVDWLPVLVAPPKEADDNALCTSWQSCIQNGQNLYTWLAVGLARFAGLRRSEIEHARRSWVVEDRGQVFIELRDREDEGFRTKTGRVYRALVINDELAQALLALPDGYLVNPPVDDRHRWFERDLPNWCRPFTGAAQKPLHRLRGLYADNLARLTEDAVIARLAAVKTAQENLGHTSSATTLNHYLSRATVR